MKQCLILFLLTACSLRYHTPPHITYVNELTSRFSRAYQDNNQLLQTGSGGGMADDIECISCAFTGCHEMDIEKGRRLYVDGIESLCYMINNDLTIRSYLHEYPFTQKNIEMSLSFKDPVYFLSRLAPDISFIFCARGIIYYYTCDPHTRQYIEQYKEPYAEAERIVHAERQSLLAKGP